jgi:hypothetical protein
VCQCVMVSLGLCIPKTVEAATSNELNERRPPQFYLWIPLGEGSPPSACPGALKEDPGRVFFGPRFMRRGRILKSDL